jgi:putative heme transporter
VRGEPVSGRTRGRWSRAFAFALGAVVAVGALLAVLSSSGGIDDVLAALEHVSPGWVFGAVVATVGGYALLAVHMRRLAGGRISVWQAARADLLLFGLGNVLPGSPAPGALLAAAELRRDGLSARRARFVLAFTMWFNVRTLLGIGAIAFLVAFARQHPGVREAGLWWLAAVGLILALAASAALAARPTTAEHTTRLFARLRVTRPHPPPDATRAGADAWHAEAKATVGSPHNRVVLVTLMAGSWLADAACLWLALASAGVRLDADVVVLAYAAGIVIGSLPLLPGEIGAVEAAIPAVLHHFGAPLDAALAGTLVYRGISFLLPLGAGVMIFAQASMRARRHHPNRTANQPEPG